MQRTIWMLLFPLLSVLLIGCAAHTGATPSTVAKGQTPTGGTAMILVFSKTTGYRHASIKDGIAALRALAAEHKVEAVFTEDAADFTAENLAKYRAVVFLSTSGTLFNDGQRAAFEQYIRAGGGYVGIHSASDTEYHWPWYGSLVGAYFHEHPAIQQATVDVEDAAYAKVWQLPQHWVRSDEWYNFRSNPRTAAPHVHVLISLDESTYHGGTMGTDHPLAWQHEFDGGRAWYTGMGHTSESYADPLFLRHLWSGIAYAGKFTNK